MWRVVDNEFNRAHYRDMIGRTLPTPGSYMVVEQVPAPTGLDPEWTHTRQRHVTYTAATIFGRRVNRWEKIDETESGIWVDGIPYYQAPIEILAAIVSVLDLGELTKALQYADTPLSTRIVDAFGAAVERAASRYLVDHVF